ncbi:hypothetical protein O9H85_22115 [Paenibacillus filicis]|uniref:DUF4309 domain-containing protein n=1 Tax=Paenibacillus gyeongsangnamensis TaxID=3388067 RepID=A0ABT4QDV2_9BACL|nr:hypothetical protein [Paenibacillus filicis]MCZ8515066.1 hypothetical protein [Paenibacillus filicis]
MRIRLMIALAFVIIASGCTQGTANPESSQGTQSEGAGGTTGGGGSSTASQSSDKGNTGKKEVPPSVISKEQADQISMTSTYEDMVKLTGSKGKQIKEESGKKTYEFALSNPVGYYLALVYSDDGKLTEKRIYQK